MPWQSPGPSGSARRRLRTSGAVLGLGLAGAITLVATHSPPTPNGLGLLPSTQTLLESSGVTLRSPTSPAVISSRQAVAAATAAQSQSQVVQVLLADAIGARGSAISPPGRLCWVVFLSPGVNSLGNALAPGQIQLDTELVDAQSGALIEGFILFHSSTPNSQVGTE